MCHYCGASIKITGKCPQCGSTSLFTETPGTQKLEEELHERFPSARVLRMDADTMTAKGAHERLLNKFGKGEADILIGTQMVTKGLDFENVTLVGVLDADQSLYAQDYRAHERTFSLITQVVGRAGRRFDTGRAVIQTYSPLHPVILTAARQDYEAFYESEMQTREALRCPPVCDITMITAVGELEQQVLSSLLALKNTPAEPDGRAVCRCESTRARPRRGADGQGDGTVSLPPHHPCEGLCKMAQAHLGRAAGVYAGR